MPILLIAYYTAPATRWGSERNITEMTSSDNVNCVTRNELFKTRVIISRFFT